MTMAMQREIPPHPHPAPVEGPREILDDALDEYWNGEVKTGLTSTPEGAEELARTAAEVAAMVTRHREELGAVMAELTALQRTLRGEVRAVVAELDRVASGVGSDPVIESAGERSGSEVSARSRYARLRRRR